MKKKLRNVMIVDDDSLVHFLSKKVLSAYACINNIYSAYDGKEALDLLRRTCSDLVSVPSILLLDLHMPIMDGFQFFEEAMRGHCLKDNRIVTIMFSSTCDPCEVDKAHALGINYFFSKPILLEKIDSVFAKEFC